MKTGAKSIEKVCTLYGVTRYDSKIIFDVVETFGFQSPDKLRRHLLNIFSTDIKRGHFDALAFFMGVKFAALNSEQKLNQIFLYEN